MRSARLVACLVDFDESFLPGKAKWFIKNLILTPPTRQINVILNPGIRRLRQASHCPHNKDYGLADPAFPVIKESRCEKIGDCPKRLASENQSSTL
jgi:hypothetical protein